MAPQPFSSGVDRRKDEDELWESNVLLAVYNFTKIPCHDTLDSIPVSAAL